MQDVGPVLASRAPVHESMPFDARPEGADLVQDAHCRGAINKVYMLECLFSYHSHLVHTPTGVVAVHVRAVQDALMQSLCGCVRPGMRAVTER